uniref:Uncharacterized protein n=1 Tax=Setaria viridis TaxID=4556 RepID=A0A4U6VYY3_SETVI|nr:hypothetical protein SEVIR_2G224000v2 [Setaria viridis]
MPSPTPNLRRCIPRPHRFRSPFVQLRRVDALTKNNQRGNNDKLATSRKGNDNYKARELSTGRRKKS